MFILICIYWNLNEENFFYKKTGTFSELYSIAYGMNALAEITCKKGKGGRGMNNFEEDKYYFSTFEELSIILVDEKVGKDYL